MKLETASAKEIMSCFGDYFKETIFYDGMEEKFNAFIKDHESEIIGPFLKANEEQTNDVIFALASAYSEGRIKSQEILSAAGDKILICILIRMETVTTFLQGQNDKILPVANNMPQFIIDYLLNCWRIVQTDV